MKKLFCIFTVALILSPYGSFGAVSATSKSYAVKKAAPVTTQSSGGLSGGLASATSLLPTVINFVQGVQQLKKAQQQLTADCAPSVTDINTVNDMVKEWAKIGDTAAKDSYSNLGRRLNKNETYKNCMEGQDDEGCYDVFDSNSDKGYIWYGFPKASKDKLDNKKDVSNIYVVFEKIPFGPEDYTKNEFSKIKSLMEKTERCAPDTLSRKKRELWGNFLIGTISKVGDATGTAGVSDVMGLAQTLGASSGTSGVSSILSTFGNQALKSFDK